MKNPDDKVAAFHERCTVAIIHDHRPVGPDLASMKAGGVTAKVYQVALDVNPDLGCEVSRSREEGWLQLATRGIEEALDDMERNRDRCRLALTARDIESAKKEGFVAILLGAEGARWLEGEIENLERFYQLGLREMQLSWAFPNALLQDKRLSPFGADVLEACERLGIIVDLTHLPEKAFYDVADIALKPLIVSHGAARGVTTDLDDARIRALAETGGLLGVHFYTTYLGPDPTPEGVLRQIDYLAELVGIDHVALGADFFPTEGAWRKLQEEQGATNLQWAVNDMSEIPLITECLFQHGYNDADMEKVLGGNFLRVCREVFGG